MIKLKLEELLEAGLYALRSELEGRLYYEDVLLGAQVDDMVSPIQIKDLPLIINPDITEFQIHRSYGDSFFRRIGRCGPFEIEYVVETTEKGLQNYRQEADKLITLQKISDELVFVYYRGQSQMPLPVAVVHIQHYPGPKVSVEIDEIPEELSGSGLSHLKSTIKNLEGKPYEPFEVYRAIIRFLNPNPHMKTS